MRKRLICLLIISSFFIYAGGQKESGAVKDNKVKEQVEQNKNISSDVTVNEAPLQEPLQNESVSLDKTLVTVNLYKFEGITQRQFDEKRKILEKQMGISFNQNQKKELLDAMVDELLIAQSAEKDGVSITEAQVLQVIRQNLISGAASNAALAAQFQKATTEEIKAIVDKQLGIPWDIYVSIARNQILQQKYIVEKKKSVFQAMKQTTDSDIIQFYKENEMSFNNPDYVRFSQIFFDTRKAVDDAAIEVIAKKAESVLKKITRKENTFEKSVREFSEDEVSKARNGDIGFIPKNDPTTRSVLGDEFFDKIFEAIPGDTVLLLKSKIGYHIVRVTEHIDSRFLKIDDAINPIDKTTVRQYIKYQLSNKLQQETFQAAAVELLAELKEKTDINFLTEKY